MWYYCWLQASQLCCETVERLFRDDLVGEVSLEVCFGRLLRTLFILMSVQCVRLICKLVKSKSYNTRPAVSD